MILSSLPLLSVLFCSSSLSLTCKTRGRKLKVEIILQKCVKEIWSPPPPFFSPVARRDAEARKKRIVGFLCVCGKLNVRTGSESNAHFSFFETEWRRRSLLVLPAVGPSLYAGGGPPDLAAHTNTAPFSSSSGNSRVFGKRRRRRRRVVEWGAGGWAFCCHHYYGGGGGGGRILRQKNVLYYTTVLCTYFPPKLCLK